MRIGCKGNDILGKRTASVQSFLRPVFEGSLSHGLLEHAADVLGILKSQFVCNLADALFQVEHSFLGQSDHMNLDLFLSRTSCPASDQVDKVVGPSSSMPIT